MAVVIFYEKPGCVNNTRQKNLLRKAGHKIVARNLLTENWLQHPRNLKRFFAGKPVHEWFNKSAPAIKQGTINPQQVDSQQAIALMLADPILIRRPLLQVGEQRMVGFNEQEIEQWIGLFGNISNSNLETCPKHHESSCQHD